MRSDRREQFKRQILEAREYEFYCRSKGVVSILDSYKYVSDEYGCADPDEIRIATLEAWGLLKRNSDLTGNPSSREKKKYEF